MNVGYVLTEEQLRTYFSQYGTVLDVYLPKHKSGRNKGFGFTTFETEEELERALQVPEHVINSATVKINRAGPRPEYAGSQNVERDNGDAPSNMPDETFLDSCGHLNEGVLQHGRGPRLYVGGIHADITDDDVKMHFSRWGRVIDVYFPARGDAGKKGARRVNYCFVTFESKNAAQHACNESERSINGRALQSISLAEDRTKLDAQRAADSFAPEFPLSPLATRQSTSTISPFVSGNASPALLAQLAGLSGYAGGASHVPDAAAQNLNQLLQAAQQLQALQQLGQAGSPSLHSINPMPQLQTPGETLLQQLLEQQLQRAGMENHSDILPPSQGPRNTPEIDLHALLASTYGGSYMNMGPPAAQPLPNYVGRWHSAPTSPATPVPWASPFSGRASMRSAMQDLLECLQPQRQAPAVHAPLHMGLSPVGTPRAAASGVPPELLMARLLQQQGAGHQSGSALLGNAPDALLGNPPEGTASMGFPFSNISDGAFGGQAGAPRGAWAGGGIPSSASAADVSGFLGLGLPESVPRFMSGGSRVASPLEGAVLSGSMTTGTSSVTPVGTPVIPHRWEGMCTAVSSPRTAGDASSLGGSLVDDAHKSEAYGFPGMSDLGDISAPAGDYALPFGLFDEECRGIVHHLPLAHHLAHRALGMMYVGIGGLHYRQMSLKPTQSFLISGSRHAQTARIVAAHLFAFIHSSSDMYEFFMASLWCLVKLLLLKSEVPPRKVLWRFVLVRYGYRDSEKGHAVQACPDCWCFMRSPCSLRSLGKLSGSACIHR
eukprot:jgi/Botrbrau1/10513/Bobra.0133s0113.2